MKRKEKKAYVKKHVDRKLLIRIRIYLAIIAIMLILSVYNISVGKIDFFLALGGLLFGGVVGFLFGRIYRIYRHEDSRTVISQIDTAGGVLLVVYILVEVGKKYVFGYWLQGTVLTAFGLAFLAGLFIGRVFSMLNTIKRVLREERIV